MTSRAISVNAYTPGSGLLPDRRELVKRTVIPYQYEILNDRVADAEKSHAVENLRVAAKKLRGEPTDDDFYGYVFQDSDLAKWLEAASFALADGDAGLVGKIDEVVDLLAASQHPDGYLNSYFTIKAPDRRWTDLQEAHELYCAGHLIEAACANYEVTGSDKLLGIMRRCADHIYDHFMTENTRGYSGHPEIELALMKLYRATGDERYKQLCGHFLDVRGQSPNYFVEEQRTRGWNVWGSNSADTDYTQSTLPVREQSDAVGHAVRAVYLYTAMADYARESGDEAMTAACYRLWDSITRRRMYVTGGIGSTDVGEAFSTDYDLPNDTVYAETCASIGLIFFARKMLELEAKGEYGDVMERALYNTVLAGMQLDGTRFFYVNPLEVTPGISGSVPIQRHVLTTRPRWYACMNAVLTPHVARLLASIGSYAYTVGDDTLFCHLYLGGRVDSGLGYALNCTTDYPHCGEVRYRFEGGARTTVALRIPAWSKQTTVKVNGEAVDLDAVTCDGYAYITRDFRDGDEILLSLDMTPRKVYANPKISADVGRVAIQRGPLVYCAEGVDNDGDVHSLILDADAAIEVYKPDPDLLGGVVPISVSGWRVAGVSGLYTDERPARHPTTIRMIPYYAWANRGENQMRVWMVEQ